MHPNDWEARRQERWARRQERWERRHAYAGSKPLGGVVFGLILIGGGLLFLLRNLGIVYFDDLWSYWPVILIVLGAAKLVTPRHGGEVTSGLILAGIGTVFLLRKLDIIHGNIWGFVWPAVFIIIGLSMLLRNLYGPDWFHGGPPAASPAATPEDAKTEYVSLIFGGTDRRNTSQEFEGGRISVVFGEANIDLTGAASKLPQVIIHADAVFGAVNLRLPATWEVEVRGSGVFGGYEDMTHRPAVPGTKCVVRGGAVFGGVTVRN